MRKLLPLAIALAAISPVHAQIFGKNGGIGSNTSSYASGEPTGGTYFINGLTGASFFGAQTITGFSNLGQTYIGYITSSNKTSNWIETLRPASTSIAQSTSVSSAGFIGQVVGSRSSDNVCTGGCQGVIGTEAIMLNDNVTSGQIQTVYGAYLEATRASGAGTTQGIEVDVRNRGTLIPVVPSAMYPTGATPGVWIGSGAGESGSANNSAAIGIVPNGSRWDKGLVFDQNAIAVRVDNLAEAVTIGKNQAITWRDASGVILGDIYGTGTGSGTTRVDLSFASGTSAVFTTAAASPLLSIGQDRVTGSVPIILPNYTVALLPTCSSDKKGAMAAATDLTAITYNASPTGGGSLSAPVYCTGTSWTIH